MVLVLTFLPRFPGGEVAVGMAEAGEMGVAEDTRGIGTVLDASAIDYGLDSFADAVGAVVGAGEQCVGTEEVEVVGCTTVVGGTEVAITWSPGSVLSLKRRFQAI